MRNVVKKETLFGSCFIHHVFLARIIFDIFLTCVLWNIKYHTVIQAVMMSASFLIFISMTWRIRKTYSKLKHCNHKFVYLFCRWGVLMPQYCEVVGTHAHQLQMTKMVLFLISFNKVFQSIYTQQKNIVSIKKLLLS